MQKPMESDYYGLYVLVIGFQLDTKFDTAYLQFHKNENHSYELSWLRFVH
ncbi:MAG: hypothetical protein SFY67_15650 [Candidatus Melainabacteria bacterium]|nr:hypothetical protein [Candidatus Melainabacteria bacterium]